MNRWGKVAVAAAAAWGLWTAPATEYAAAYTVQPGDYLWKIATEHGMAVAELTFLNGLRSTAIYPGQTLRVPDPVDAYTVQAGDAMWSIALKFGLSADQLIAANPQLADPNVIRQGMLLSIPQRPIKFADGLFPLKKGSYEPFQNDYSAGRSWTPEGQAVRTHEGVDIFAKKGTPVHSAMDGTVIRHGWSEYGGWRLTIRVDDSAAFYYAHLSRYAAGIQNGSVVKKGQLIGYVGNTGYGPEGTEGQFLPHLHFGIYDLRDWSTQDPYPFLRWWSL